MAALGKMTVHCGSKELLHRSKAKYSTVSSFIPKWHSMSETKAALIVVPSPKGALFVDSSLIPGVKGSYAEIVVGTTYAEFEPVLARHEHVVVACGLFTSKVKQIFADIVTKSPKAKLVWVHSFTSGVDHLLTPELKELDVPVTNAKGCFSQSSAEYVLFGCMYYDKEVTRLQGNRVQAKWERFQMGELQGQTMGIIGYGDIGQATGRLAKAFKMNVLAYRRTATGGSSEVKMCVGEEGLNHLLQTSDFVVAALPGTPHTRHFINADRIAKMKPSAVFINVGRGVCVDEAALAQALAKRQIKGACLDVYEVEPLPSDSPLWKLDNVLLSPHSANNTAAHYPTAFRHFVELSTNYFLKGVPFPSLVDLEHGY